MRDLVPFVQFKKREKHPWRSVNFSKLLGLRPVTLLKLTLHGCFSRFLNFTNCTKSRNTSRISFGQCCKKTFKSEGLRKKIKRGCLCKGVVHTVSIGKNCVSSFPGVVCLVNCVVRKFSFNFRILVSVLR